MCSNRSFCTLKFDLFCHFFLSEAMLSGAGGKGGSSFQQAAGELPPLKSGAGAGQGEPSFQEPVEAKVIEIDPNREKFTVIQPSVPEMPGTTLPYPTAGIRQAMNRPNCTAVGKEIILYGYFWNADKNVQDFFGRHGVSNKEVPPFHDEQNYISLRASPAECLDRPTWGKGKKESADPGRRAQ